MKVISRRTVLVPGDVVAIPINSKFILGQIGIGDDIGIFSELLISKEQKLKNHYDILFRVHFGRKSPVENKWIILENREFLNPALSIPAEYGSCPVGSDKCYLVTEGHEDIPVTRDAALRYEQLATWSHEHITKRFLKHQ